MMTLEKFLLFVAVLSIQTSLFSPNFISQIIKGNIAEERKLNFTIYTEEFQGILLYSFDSFKNQFGIKIIKKNQNEKFIQINFNKEFKKDPLKSICGCDPCDKRMMHFDVVMSSEIIKVVCNNIVSQSIFTKNKTGETISNNDVVMYTIPLFLRNISNSVYIMMGNIGPCMDENNFNVTPSKDQIVGCLETFSVNNQNSQFNQTGLKMHSSCLRQCTKNTCNGGRCRVKMESGSICDCSSTALNGPYCNRSMKVYYKSNNNFYKKKEASFIYMKLTWRAVLNKMYCLMEIKSEGAELTIWTNKSHLMMDTVVLLRINMDEIYFININITGDKLKLNVENKILNKTKSLFNKTKINVGFCERNQKYETFEGMYDFDYDPSQLQQYVQVSMVSKDTNVNLKPKDINYILIFSLVTIFCILIFVVIITILYHKSRKEMQQEITNINSRSNFSIGPPNETFRESGLYGIVEDSTYDYIQDFTFKN